MDQQLLVLKNKKDIELLLEYLEGKEFIAVDTETTGVIRGSEIIGYSICAESGVGYYVITAYWDKMSQKLIYNPETIELTPKVMRLLKTKSLIMHNAVFDCDMIEQNYGVSLIESCHTDTMLLAHLLDENRRVGLKDLGVNFYGEDAQLEQQLMKESVANNGGALTKDNYELYKGDSELIAKYGAKDAVLTFNLFYEMVPKLYEQNLDRFFYEEETMPLLRGPTYQLNTVGMAVDIKRLQELKTNLEVQILELAAFIHKEIDPIVKDKYPGTTVKNTFNMNSGAQLAWLLFERLGNVPGRLTDTGKELSKHLIGKLPYTVKDKKSLIEDIRSQTGYPCKGKTKVKDYWSYFSTDENSLKQFTKYKWIESYLELKKSMKMLNTYVLGIESKMQYGIIRPNFIPLTTSGRYSSKNPNFTNLPAGDKRIKSCIISRPGKVFVGGDWEQIEPRIFASLSGDERLLSSFSKGEDFYSVVGSGVFGIGDCTLKKDGSDNSFPVKYKDLRQLSKIIALSIPYGTTAPKLRAELEADAGIVKSIQECQDIIDDYLSAYPKVAELILSSHKKIKENGYIETLFGRVRRIPEAMRIEEQYGQSKHSELPANIRNYLNQAMNFPIQSAAASILDRCMIAFELKVKELNIKNCHIVLCVHDEIVAECMQKDAELVRRLLKDCMENTVRLPGVGLIANPVIANNLADLK